MTLPEDLSQAQFQGSSAQPAAPLGEDSQLSRWLHRPKNVILEQMLGLVLQGSYARPDKRQMMAGDTSVTETLTSSTPRSPEQCFCETSLDFTQSAKK